MENVLYISRHIMHEAFCIKNSYQLHKRQNDDLSTTYLTSNILPFTLATSKNSIMNFQRF